MCVQQNWLKRVVVQEQGGSVRSESQSKNLLEEIFTMLLTINAYLEILICWKRMEQHITGREQFLLTNLMLPPTR